MAVSKDNLESSACTSTKEKLGEWYLQEDFFASCHRCEPSHRKAQITEQLRVLQPIQGHGRAQGQLEVNRLLQYDNVGLLPPGDILAINVEI